MRYTIPIAVGVISFGLVYTLAKNTMTSKHMEEDQYVLCGVLFGFDMEGLSMSDVYDAEELANAFCSEEDMSQRTETLVYHKTPVEGGYIFNWARRMIGSDPLVTSYSLHKQTVVITKDNTLIINWGLSPQALKQAVSDYLEDGV